MRYPWEFGAPPPDDQEGLQTDVMRFIAILGLCLAAIFSLVTAVEKERSAAVPAVEAAVSPPVMPVAAPAAAKPAAKKSRPQRALPISREPSRQAQAIWEEPPQLHEKAVPIKEAPPEPVVVKQEPARQSASPSQQQGFSLEFESTGALQQLLDSNAVQLYANMGQAFWKLGGDGRFESSGAPASYYSMHSDTLPEPIRQASSGLGDLSRLAWGVTLPEATARQIQRMMSNRAGGDLVIRPDASVMWGLN